MSQSYNKESFRPGPVNPERLKQLSYFKRELLDFNRPCKLTLVVEAVQRPRVFAEFTSSQCSLQHRKQTEERSQYIIPSLTHRWWRKVPKHWGSGEDVKCSHYKRLYVGRERGVHFSLLHMRIYTYAIHMYIHVLYVCTYMYSGKYVLQLHVQIEDEQPSAVGEVLGQEGLCKGWHRACLRSCLLSCRTAEREAFSSCCEDPLWWQPWTCRGQRASNGVGSPPESAFLALRRALSQNNLGWKEPVTVKNPPPPKKCWGLAGGCGPSVHQWSKKEQGRGFGSKL